MDQESRAKRLRVGVMLDLTWNLKRHTDVFAGVAHYAHEHDWQCIIDDFATDTLKRLKGRPRPYDGIIGRVTPELAEVARRRKLPLVNVWYSSPVKGGASVLYDPRGAGELMAEHLLARGIRRFLCLVRRTDAGEKAIAQRVEQLAKEHSGTCETFRVSLRFAHSAAQWRKTRATIDKWLRHVPTPAGVVCGVDILTRHIVQICDEIGLRVPQDVAIAGGCNELTICLRPEPALTSVEFGLEHIGYEAARMMHRLLKGEELPQRVVTVPPQELVVRHSSDFIYVDEQVVSAAMQFIAQHASQRISVADVAAAVSVSRRTLENRFEKHLGRTVAAEIRRVRLEQAKRLLASSDESIARIGRLTGIGTPQQFARVFRREVGISPSEYRGQFVDKD